jgi:hypothetical protein
MQTLDQTIEPVKTIVSVLWKYIEEEYDPATNQQFFLCYGGAYPITYQHIHDSAIVLGIIDV